ncbi:MAG: MipA/OmpV family protein [Epsilonproteobacteria bacterium]|nr:MipA/OmpV family protein [Campylobacterota bacterium]
MRFLVVIFIILMTLDAKEPKLEFGLGAAVVSYPDYIGASRTQTLVTPFPYIRYRGENFQIEKGGIKRELFEIDGLSADLSLGGSLPSDSEGSKAREEMDDLDLTFELGPKISYDFYKVDSHKLRFVLPIRAVFSTDFKAIHGQGFLTTPRLRYEYEYKHLDISVGTGPMFASRGYYDYFYEVSLSDATPTREAYSVSSGYGGYRNSIGVKYRKGKLWCGAFASHFILKDAVFEASPLVQEKNALFFGLSFAYIFYTR